MAISPTSPLVGSLIGRGLCIIQPEDALMMSGLDDQWWSWALKRHVVLKTFESSVVVVSVDRDR